MRWLVFLLSTDSDAIDDFDFSKDFKAIHYTIKTVLAGCYLSFISILNKACTLALGMTQLQKYRLW